MGKYSHLKGTIPKGQKEPTPRDAAIAAEIKRLNRLQLSLADLATGYNRLMTTAEASAKNLARINVQLEAHEQLLLGALESSDLERATADGYTWSEGCEPYPVCEDPAAIVAYFKENGMEEQLALTKTELASRLKTFVKEEAVNNELIIETKVIPHPVTGEEIEVPDVRSKVPGVRVFLKTSLSRRKAGQ